MTSSQITRSPKRKASARGRIFLDRTYRGAYAAERGRCSRRRHRDTACGGGPHASAERHALRGAGSSSQSLQRLGGGGRKAESRRECRPKERQPPTAELHCSVTAPERFGDGANVKDLNIRPLVCPPSRLQQSLMQSAHEYSDHLSAMTHIALLTVAKWLGKELTGFAFAKSAELVVALIFKDDATGRRLNSIEKYLTELDKKVEQLAAMPTLRQLMAGLTFLEDAMHSTDPMARIRHANNAAQAFTHAATGCVDEEQVLAAYMLAVAHALAGDSGNANRWHAKCHSAARERIRIAYYEFQKNQEMLHEAPRRLGRAC